MVGKEKSKQSTYNMSVWGPGWLISKYYCTRLGKQYSKGAWDRHKTAPSCWRDWWSVVGSLVGGKGEGSRRKLMAGSMQGGGLVRADGGLCHSPAARLSTMPTAHTLSQAVHSRCSSASAAPPRQLLRLLQWVGWVVTWSQGAAPAISARWGLNVCQGRGAAAARCRLLPALFWPPLLLIVLQAGCRPSRSWLLLSGVMGARLQEPPGVGGGLVEALLLLLLLPLAGRRGRGVGRLGPSPACLAPIAGTLMDDRRRQVARERCCERRVGEESSTACESSERGMRLHQASIVARIY